MNFFKLSYFVIFLSVSTILYAQDKTFKIHTIAFYNLENVFDTINDPLKFDEYSPIMELKTNRKEAYLQKTRNMARVISEIGKDDTKNAPVILGVCEVENRTVLEDIVNDSLLIEKNYSIIHHDSPDARGIDVGLIYQPNLFTPTNTNTYELKIYDDQDGTRITTRDQLVVSGQLEDETIHIIVNHWPSRRGGEARSRPKRIAAAKLNRRIVDSLQNKDPYGKIIIMGDLNDNPNNPSIKDALQTERKRKKVRFKGLYNPYENYYRDGLGTTAYRDNWSLFDQIIISKPLLEKDYTSFRYYKAGIFNKNYLITSNGKYKGYPFRSWSNGSFSNGYSDHFPVYMYLIKEIPTVLSDIVPK
ncbi:endonuclease/exonuclease/phosphatase family protein [Hyunsoonleella pacifica]|uniref:Endonuclease/exonuclease/phosphatase family protein n=1 Tax=Hyunsoonleella pacifica TaxID=1080224 RepID=A0A4Q9FNK2_9FLAO|nr:endonuclease/exonuclease/phosphatase family protein [Hyunsoonleella pacifica]TBN16366.1 endonuclease/exonuclease/phosphatase family protein [Hyunsoonleella pacifica]GGD20043.1 endonuclease [Hyunsoonleella pacifica]